MKTSEAYTAIAEETLELATTTPSIEFGNYLVKKAEVIAYMARTALLKEIEEKKNTKTP